MPNTRKRADACIANSGIRVFGKSPMWRLLAHAFSLTPLSSGLFGLPFQIVSHPSDTRTNQGSAFEQIRNSQLNSWMSQFFFSGRQEKGSRARNASSKNNSARTELKPYFAPDLS